METPIQTTESAIENEKLWACIKVALISLLWIPLTSAATYILVDQKFMNKPIQVIERKETVWEVQSIYEATILEEGKWDFVPKDTPIKKENKK